MACCVCYNNFNKRRKKKILKCHKDHLCVPCFNKMMRNGIDRCPICREPMCDDERNLYIEELLFFSSVSITFNIIFYQFLYPPNHMHVSEPLAYNIYCSMHTIYIISLMYHRYRIAKTLRIPLLAITCLSFLNWIFMIVGELTLRLDKHSLNVDKHSLSNKVETTLLILWITIRFILSRNAMIIENIMLKYI